MRNKSKKKNKNKWKMNFFKKSFESKLFFHIFLLFSKKKCYLKKRVLRPQSRFVILKLLSIELAREFEGKIGCDFAAGRFME